MRLLVKIGGTLLESGDALHLLGLETAALVSRGHRVVVVHGGGKQLTRRLEERGVPSRFVNGLRVTTPETLAAVVQVLAGEVNLGLVSAFQQAGVNAVGLNGVDSGLVEAAQLAPELGAVGSIERVRPGLLEALTAAGYVPVVACLAAGPHGEVFNVNADEMAVAVAANFLAEQLIFLTDVPGVLDAERRIVSQLTPEQAEELIRAGVARAGMEAKLRACCRAIRQGVPQVRIAPGAEPRILGQLLNGRATATAIVAGARERA